jgi:hypothetical protein
MNKTKKYFMAAAVISLLPLMFFGCGNDPDDTNPDGIKGGGGIELSTTAFVADVSPFLNYEWDRVDTEYQWLSATDGTISIGDGKGGASDCCCGLGVVMSPSYFFNGNCLFTYTPEMDEPDRLMVFTLSEDGSSLTRDIGTSRETATSFNFRRGNHRGTASSKSPLKLSNPLLGTWQGDDGKKYIFNEDGGLKINSVQYGYLVKNNDFVIIGPLVKEKTPILQKYQFTKNSYMKQLNLRDPNGKIITLVLSEK